jgi:hypothetical protein
VQARHGGVTIRVRSRHQWDVPHHQCNSKSRYNSKCSSRWSRLRSKQIRGCTMLKRTGVQPHLFHFSEIWQQAQCVGADLFAETTKSEKYLRRRPSRLSSRSGDMRLRSKFIDSAWRGNQSRSLRSIFRICDSWGRCCLRTT